MRDIVMICIYSMISWMRRTLLFINMNMIVVYYFKVYAGLRYVITKLLPYVKKTVLGDALVVFSFIRSPGNLCY